MTDEIAFLRALSANPDDDTSRLVFADWLEERGDHRASWLRDPALVRWMPTGNIDPIPNLLTTFTYDADHQRQEEARQLLPRLGPALIRPLISFAVEQRETFVWYLLDDFARLPITADHIEDVRSLLRHPHNGCRSLGIALTVALGQQAEPLLPDVLHNIQNADGSESESRRCLIQVLKRFPTAAKAASSWVLDTLSEEGPGLLRLLEPFDAAMLAELLHRFNDHEWSDAQWLTDSLDSLAEQQPDLLLPHLQHPRQLVRYVVAMALLPTHPEAALPPILEVLRDSCLPEHLEYTLLQRIAEYGEAAATALPILLDRLTRFETSIFTQLARTIAAIGGNPSDPNWWLSKLGDPQQRLQVLEAISQLGEIPAELREPIRDSLDHEDPYIRSTAIGLLKREPLHDDSVVPSLLALLERETEPQVIVSILQFLVDLDDDELLVPLLLRYRQHHHADVRSAVLIAFNATGEWDETIHTALRHSLSHEEADTRRQAVETIGTRDPVVVGAVPQLLEMMHHDPDEQVRYAIVHIIKQFDLSAEETVEHLRQRIFDANGRVRDQALDRLRLVAEYYDMREAAVAILPDLFRLYDQLSVYERSELEYVFETLGNASLPGLYERAESPDVERVERILALIAKIRPASEIPLPELLAILQHQQPDERVRGLRLALERGDRSPELIRHVHRLLHDPYPAVRSESVRFFASLGTLTPEHERSLWPMFRDPDGSVRCETLRSIGPLLDRVTYLNLLGAAFADADSRLVTQAIEDVHRLGLNELRSEVAHHLSHRDPGVRSAAIRTILDIGPVDADVVDSLIAALRDTDNEMVRYAAANALEKAAALADRVVVPLATMATEDPSLDNRARALETLAELGEAATTAIPAITRMLQSDNWETRKRAAEAFAAIGPTARAAIPDLLAALHDPRWTERDRRPAAGGVLTQLMSSLRDAIPGDRRIPLVKALGAIGDPVVIPALKAVATDTTEPLFLLALAEAFVQLGDEGEAFVREWLTHENPLFQGAAEYVFDIDSDDETSS